MKSKEIEWMKKNIQNAKEWLVSRVSDKDINCALICLDNALEFKQSLSPNQEVVSQIMTAEDILYEFGEADERINGYRPATVLRALNFALDLMRSKQSEPSKWISVEERLPEKDKNDMSKKVLIIYSTGLQNVAYYDYELKRFTCELYDIVSHWQPLPAPPTKQEGL